MKTDFSARSVCLQYENRIRTHFLVCLLLLPLYRLLEKKLDYQYTCEEILDTLKARNKLPYSVKQDKTTVSLIYQGFTAVFSFINCQRQDYNTNSSHWQWDIIYKNSYEHLFVLYIYKKHFTCYTYKNVYGESLWKTA